MRAADNSGAVAATAARRTLTPEIPPDGAAISGDTNIRLGSRDYEPQSLVPPSVNRIQS